LGCDSIVTTNLTVNKVYNLSIDTTICGGNYKGHSASGTFTENLKTVLGCDSIVTTNLTVNKVYNLSIDTTICGGNYKGHSASGTFTENLKTVLGCDSIVTTNLTVNIVPASPVITLNNDTLQSNAPDGNQWYSNDTIITNAVSNTFIPALKGDYYAIVTLNNCSSRESSTISYFPASVNEVMDYNEISTYPNPTSGTLRIVLKDKFNSGYDVVVYNNVGVLIQTIKKSKLESNFDLDFGSYSTGIYLIRIHANDKFYESKVVKK
jgi:hypothetical protein